ncbi:MAG: hypothetical protein GPOALKHO_000230 [Sodalis sp.]|nr:MAG: hypothetical protein GPOALKHO_000230 [Sodalis sp.]
MDDYTIIKPFYRNIPAQFHGKFKCHFAFCIEVNRVSICIFSCY